jgi:hypothetical protein
MLYKPTQPDMEGYQEYDICVLMPVGSYHLWAKTAKALANMIAYSWACGLRVWQVGITERMVVDWARNDLARTARNKINEYTGRKFTHLLWIDDDHTFNPDMAVYLARHGDKDMVSALYYGRTQHLPVAYVKDKTDDPYKHYPLVEVPNKLVQVDAVGFGALLMRRDVLDRVPEPWFTIDYRAGEDIAFCVSAKRAGVTIYVDGSYRLGHIGDPVIVTEAEYKRYLESRPELQDRVQVMLDT